MKTFFKIIYFLRYPLIFIGICVLIFLISCGYWVKYYYDRGSRFKKETIKKIKPKSVIRRLFIDLPQRIIKDKYEKEPGTFEPRGIIVFCGEQGGGKTSAMIKYTIDLQEQYKESKCITNLAYKYQDEKLTHWRQLTDYKNGRKGVIVVIDELQNWFNSKQSKNFPPEMMAVVTQNRKNRRIILSTAQNFYMISKDIRTQCNEIRQCRTFLGCLTVVHRMKPLCDNSGEVIELKHIGFYFFIHSDKLRNAYDTYEVIKSLANSGFNDRNVTNISQ